MSEAIKKHFSKEELENMTVEDLVELVGVMPGEVKFEAKAAVFDKDGNPKYDNPTNQGQYDEV